MQWYYNQDGVQQGPVEQDALLQLIANGSVRRDELVWSEGMANWVAASMVPELSTAPLFSTAPGAPPLPSGNPYAAPSPSGYQGPALHRPGPAYYGPPVPNYLWQSIVVTILCCWPFGIPAIVYATKVDTLVALGDIDGARRASESAKLWCWISFGIVAGFVGIYILFMLIGVVASAVSA